MATKNRFGLQIACAIFFFITLGIWGTELLSNPQRLKTDGPVVVIEKPATIHMTFAEEEVDVPLHRGDSLKILGIRRNTYNQTFLVETANGSRGWLDTYHLPIRQLMVKGSNEGDTITLVSQDISEPSGMIHGYKALLGDGTEIEVQAEDFEPVLENFTDLMLSDGYVTSIGTEEHYASMRGLTLEELEKKIGPAFQIYRKADGGLRAQFLAKVFNVEDGKFYRPSYTFNSGNLSENVVFEYYSDRSNSILKNLPGAGAIFNIPFTGANVRSSIYEKGYTSKTISGFKRYVMIALVVVVMIGTLFWFFLTPSIPVLAMGWLIMYPKVFALFSDKALKWTIIIVSALCTYYWAVVMLGWGMFWPFALFIIVASWYACKYAIDDLCAVPHIRCPRCHRLHTIKFDDDELYDTQYRKGADVVRDKLLGTGFSQHKTWTQVTKTTTYGDGHKESSTYRENVKNHKIRHDNYRMIDYEVTYRVDYYHDHYVCDECSHEEIVDSTICTEVDRKMVGTHVETDSYEV